jgi:hypothetical protein
LEVPSLAKTVSDPDPSTDDDQMAKFWERMGALTDERFDAAMERWQAKQVNAAGSAGSGDGAAGAGGAGGSGGTGTVNPRSKQASGGTFLDTLSRIALGKTGT